MISDVLVICIKGYCNSIFCLGGGGCLQDENKRSILDVDPEVQAIMEMTGKTLHSQGLREPEEDDG